MDYSGIIIERPDGKLLFQLRDIKDIENPGKWGIFGGGIRKNEIPLHALKRELREELGLDIKKLNVKLLISYRTFGKKWFIYYAKINRKIKMNLKEGQKMAYFHPHEVIFKRNSIFVMRIFFICYPIIKWMKKIGS